MKNIKLKDIMTPNPVSVGLDDRLYKVKEIFDTHDFRHLVVIEEEKLIGILSDRDLYRNISPNIGKARFTFNDVDTLNQPVHLIVTRHPITLGPEATLKDALDILNHHKISCIPIVDEEMKAIGILSWKDIVRNIVLD